MAKKADSKPAGETPRRGVAKDHHAALMKTSVQSIGVLVVSTCLLATACAQAQGTAFTYQGRLQDGTNHASGFYDLTFSVWTAAAGPAQIGDTVTNLATGVTNGLFAVALDFGGGVFDGNPRWLEIGVRTNGGEMFTKLSPRQSLAATPYAIYAGGVNAAGISGTIPAGNIGSGTITSNMLAPGAAAANFAATGATVLSTDPNATNLTAAGYVRVGGALDLSWQQRINDSPRSDHTAVWTGTKMIVWGGITGGSLDSLNTGGCYDPAANSWVPVTTSNAPTRRFRHTAVWAGTKMIVWGGVYYGAGDRYYQNTGGRYDPAANNWLAVTISNSPSGRESHTAVWTGSEMIIWGGLITGFPNSIVLEDGARYNPITDTWTQIATNGAPSKRCEHSAVWTGSEMIVWGGLSDSGRLNDGARYNPTTDSWTPITTNNAPVARSEHCAFWTGSEMIIFGGAGAGLNLNDGARYNPATDTWTQIATNGAPISIYRRAVWTGGEMIVWGGHWYSSYSQSGASYSPVSNTWSPVPASGGPSPRDGFSAVWTGSEMIVFGGTSRWVEPNGTDYLFGVGDTYSYTPSRVMYLYLRP